MKKTILLLLAAMACSWALAETSFDFSGSLPAGWTATVQPRGFDERGAQFSSSSELTSPEVTNVKKVTVECSCNSAEDNEFSLTVSVGETSFGVKQLAKANDQQLDFEVAEAATGVLKIVISKGSKKSVWIKTVTIDGTCDGETEEEDPLEGLDADYVYTEPTTIINDEETGSNQPYTFIQNNIKVVCTIGARYETYFSVNAGATLTFIATQPMKAIVVKGLIKKGFEAEASSGYIDYADADENEVEAEQVLAVTDIDSTILTLSCDKQMRCYQVNVYFTTTPEIDIDHSESGYSYEWEPTEPTTFNVTFDSLAYMDMSEMLGYASTDLMLFDRKNNYLLDLVVFASTIEAGTGRELETLLPVGTYPINDEYIDNTVQASPGGYDSFDFPTYFLTDVLYDENGYPHQYEPYYIVSGTLEVVAVEGGGEFVVHATSYNGTTVNATYMFAEGEPIDDAVTNTSTDRKVTKELREGRIVILRNGVAYGADGMRL